MPNLDGTGPQGQGPQTGRKQGNCSNPQQAQTRPGRGSGQGRGWCGRWCRFWGSSINPNDK